MQSPSSLDPTKKTNSFPIQARYANISRWSVPETNDKESELLYLQVQNEIIAREGALLRVKNVVKSLDTYYWKYALMRVKMADIKLRRTIQEEQVIARRIQIQKLQAELTVAIAHVRGSSIAVLEAVKAWRECLAASKATKTIPTVSVFWGDKNYLHKMVTDITDSFNFPTIRLWLGFDLNPLMLPPVHAGDPQGFSAKVRWEKEHYSHFTVWLKKRTPWLVKLERAQQAEMKRRRNDLELGLTTTTAATSSVSGNGGGGGGWSTSGSTQNNSPRGLQSMRGGGKGGVSSRPSLDQLLNDQGYGVEPSLKQGSIPSEMSNRQDGMEDMGGTGRETPGSPGGRGGAGRLSFMVLSTLRKKLTTKAGKLKEKHEEELAEAEAQAQRDALASAIAGIGSHKASKAGSRTGSFVNSNAGSRAGSRAGSLSNSLVPSLQNSPRDPSPPPIGIGKFSRQASKLQIQKVEKIIAEQQTAHSADVFQVGNGQLVHINGTIPITTWIELYNFAATSWNPRYPFLEERPNTTPQSLSQGNNQKHNTNTNTTDKSPQRKPHDHKTTTANSSPTVANTTNSIINTNPKNKRVKIDEAIAHPTLINSSATTITTNSNNHGKTTMAVQSNSPVKSTAVQSNFPDKSIPSKPSETPKQGLIANRTFWSKLAQNPVAVEASVGLIEVYPQKPIVPLLPAHLHVRCQKLEKLLRDEQEIYAELELRAIETNTLRKIVNECVTEESLEKISVESLREDSSYYSHHYGRGVEEEEAISEGGDCGGGRGSGRFSQQRDELKARQLVAHDLSEGTGVIHSPSAAASTLTPYMLYGQPRKTRFSAIKALQDRQDKQRKYILKLKQEEDAKRLKFELGGLTLSERIQKVTLSESGKSIADMVLSDPYGGFSSVRAVLSHASHQHTISSIALTTWPSSSSSSVAFSTLSKSSWSLSQDLTNTSSKTFTKSNLAPFSDHKQDDKANTTHEYEYVLRVNDAQVKQSLQYRVDDSRHVVIPGKQPQQLHDVRLDTRGRRSLDPTSLYWRNLCIIKVQRVIRGFIGKRRKYHRAQAKKIYYATILLQRFLRGAMGRKKFYNRKVEFTRQMHALRHQVLLRARAADMMASFLRRLVAHKKNERANRKSIHEIFQEQKKAKEEAALAIELARKKQITATTAGKGKRNDSTVSSSSLLTLSRYDGIMVDDDDIGDDLGSSSHSLSLFYGSENVDKSGASADMDDGEEVVGSGWKMIGAGKHAVFVKINSQRFLSQSPTHSSSQSPYHSQSSSPRGSPSPGIMGIKSSSPSSISSSPLSSPLLSRTPSFLTSTNSNSALGSMKGRLPGLQQPHQSEQLQQQLQQQQQQQLQQQQSPSNKKLVSFKSTRLAPLDIHIPSSPSSSFSSPMSSPSRLSPLHPTPTTFLPSPSGSKTGAGMGSLLMNEGTTSSSSPPPHLYKGILSISPSSSPSSPQSYSGTISSSSSPSYFGTITSPQSPSEVMLSFLSHNDDTMHMGSTASTSSPSSISPQYSNSSLNPTVNPPRSLNKKIKSLYNLTWSLSKRGNNNNNNNNNNSSQSEHLSFNSSKPLSSKKTSSLLSSSSNKPSKSDRSGVSSNSTSLRSTTVAFDGDDLSKMDSPSKKESLFQIVTLSNKDVSKKDNFNNDMSKKEKDNASFIDSHPSKKDHAKHGGSSTTLLSTFSSSSIDNTVRRSRLLPKRRSTTLNREDEETMSMNGTGGTQEQDEATMRSRRSQFSLPKKERSFIKEHTDTGYVPSPMVTIHDVYQSPAIGMKNKGISSKHKLNSMSGEEIQGGSIISSSLMDGKMISDTPPNQEYKEENQSVRNINNQRRGSSPMTARQNIPMMDVLRNVGAYSM